MPSFLEPPAARLGGALDASNVEAIRQLRATLERAQYAELVHLLRPAGELDLPWPDFPGATRQLATLAHAVAPLVRLFGTGEEVSLPDVERWLPVRLLGELIDSGLLQSPGPGAISTAGLCIVPHQGLYVLANPPPSFPTARRRQQDVCLDRDSVFLARQLRPTAVERTLEVCSGSGLLALAAARHSRQVVGCELSELAVAAARYSAVLSGLEDRVSFHQGDLFSAASGTFELVLANPPYAPVPAGSCEAFLSGDGGSDGLELVRRIIAELPAYLAPRGRAMLIAGALCDERGLLAEQELAERLAKSGLTGRLFVIDRKRIEEHIAQMRPFVDHPIHYETALAATCAALGATHYVGFYLVMEPGAAATAPLEVISPLATRSELVRALRGRRAAGGATC